MAKGGWEQLRAPARGMARGIRVGIGGAEPTEADAGARRGERRPGMLPGRAPEPARGDWGISSARRARRLPRAENPRKSLRARRGPAGRGAGGEGRPAQATFRCDSFANLHDFNIKST
jgi:hypothetical protein